MNFSGDDPQKWLIVALFGRPSRRNERQLIMV
jgi:hypothetical protein